MRAGFFLTRPACTCHSDSEKDSPWARADRISPRRSWTSAPALGLQRKDQAASEAKSLRDASPPQANQLRWDFDDVPVHMTTRCVKRRQRRIMAADEEDQEMPFSAQLLQSRQGSSDFSTVRTIRRTRRLVADEFRVNASTHFDAKRAAFATNSYCRDSARQIRKFDRFKLFRLFRFALSSFKKSKLRKGSARVS